MSKLVEKVTVIVKEQYELEAAAHGARHNSPHEASAYILEAIQDSNNTHSEANDMFTEFWKAVVNGADEEAQKSILKNMRDSAIFGACEMIKVASLAHKALQGFVINDPIIPYDPIFNTETEGDSE